MKRLQFKTMAALIGLFCAYHPGNVSAQDFPRDAIIEGKSIPE